MQQINRNGSLFIQLFSTKRSERLHRLDDNISKHVLYVNQLLLAHIPIAVVSLIETLPFSTVLGGTSLFTALSRMSRFHQFGSIISKRLSDWSCQSDFVGEMQKSFEVELDSDFLDKRCFQCSVVNTLDKLSSPLWRLSRVVNFIGDVVGRHGFASNLAQKVVPDLDRKTVSKCLLLLTIDSKIVEKSFNRLDRNRCLVTLCAQLVRRGRRNPTSIRNNRSIRCGRINGLWLRWPA
jgi:hypothetical protein